MLVLGTLLAAFITLGATTLVITHAAATAAIADRVLHLADGRLRKVEVNKKKLSPEEISW